MRRHKSLMLLSSGLAAGILLAAWLIVGHAAPVSAATIFANFKAALGKSLSIHMRNVDLGSVSVNGEVDVKRAEPGQAEDTRYAELHVLFKADNPAWQDLDGVLVMCQSPEGAWQYVRGNGGSSHRVGEVVPSESFYRGTAWQDFATRPLALFGSMPLDLSFAINGSRVAYVFHQRQRLLVEQLQRFLLDLSDAGTAEAAIDALREAAGEVRVERVDGATYELQATRFTRLGTLDLAEPEIPDVSDLVKQYVVEINYDAAAKRIVGTAGTNPPGLCETGVLIKSGTAELEAAVDSPDRLIAALRERAADVEVDKSHDPIWTIRVTGYPFPVDTSGIEWQRAFVGKLRESLKLSIYYSAASHAVQRAEFRGLGSADGCITLEVGEVSIDPRRLKAETWTTPRTKVRE